MKTYRKILSGLISIWTRFFWWMKLSPFAMSSAIFFTCQTSSFLFNCLRESISSSRFPPLQYSIWMNTLNWYKSNGHIKKWTVGNAKEPKAYGHFLRMVVKLKRTAQNYSIRLRIVFLRAVDNAILVRGFRPQIQNLPRSSSIQLE